MLDLLSQPLQGAAIGLATGGLVLGFDLVICRLIGVPALVDPLWEDLRRALRTDRRRKPT